MVSSKHFEIRVDPSFLSVLFLVPSPLSLCFVLLDKYILIISVSKFLSQGLSVSPFLDEAGLA